MNPTAYPFTIVRGTPVRLTVTAVYHIGWVQPDPFEQASGWMPQPPLDFGPGYYPAPEAPRDRGPGYPGYH